MTTTHMPSTTEIDAMTDTERKVFENRLRRAAQRQGLRLEKSRHRDPHAILYGTYQIVDARTDFVVHYARALQRGYGLNLHDVAAHLFGETVA